MFEVPKVLVPTFYSPNLKHHPCRDIQEEDCAAIPDLVVKMAQFCRDHGGESLAAPEIGLFVRLAVILNPPQKVSVLINPEITVFGGKDILEAEGCLSLPPLLEAQGRVWRSEIIHLQSGTLEDPFSREESIHRNREARIIQHQVDHLNPAGGIYFIDRLGPVTRQIVLRKFAKQMHYLNRELQKSMDIRMEVAS